jgi:hypothetical protein
MEKRLTKMLNEIQKKQVKNYVENFKLMSKEYLQKKNYLENTLKTIEEKQRELSNTAKEEIQIAAALEVLYGQSKNESKIGELQKEIVELQNGCDRTRIQVNEITGKLSELLRALPIPANLDQPIKKDTEITFPYFEDSQLGSEALVTISIMLRKDNPLTFGNVTIFEDRVVVKDVSDKSIAIQKLIKAISEFRMETDNLSKSYEKIDELVERLKRSNLYVELLKVIEKNPKISTSQIAQKLGIDERKVYDNCYNLTRSNWNPPPITKNRSGEWELTTAGEILLNRFFDKCPDKESDSHEVDPRQNGGVPNRNPNL